MLALGLLLAASAPSAAQEGWSPLPLPSLARALPGELGPPLPRDGRHVLLPREIRGEEARPVVPLPEPLFLQLIETEARRRGIAATLDAGGGMVLVRGAPAAREEVAAMARALGELEARLAVEVEVELVVEREGAEPERLLAARRGLRSGASASLGTRHVATFLADYEVDVAADSGVADPELARVLSGAVVQLFVARVRGGRDVLVEGILDVATPRAAPAFDPGVPELGLVEQPELDVTHACFAGIVASGEALEISGTGGALGGSWSLRVRARCEADAAPDAGSGWEAVDLGFLARAPRSVALAGPGFPLEWPGREDPPAMEPGVTTPGALAALVLGRQSRSAPLWSESLLFLPAEDGELRAQVRALVGALEGLALAPLRLELADPDGWTLSLPVLAGRAARVLVGREALRLVEYDTQLAPETWMPQPRVERIFDGFGLELSGGGAGSALLARSWSSRTQAVRVVDPREASLGRVQLLERSLASASSPLPSPGEELLLPSSAASPAAVRLRLDTR